MSLIGGIISGAIGSAVSSAIKNSNKNKGSSSSSSSKGSSSSSKGSSSSSSTSVSGGTSSSTSIAKPSYDTNRDYQAEINEAVKNNNYAQAAILEQQRNQKIQDMGLSYGTTNKYSQYLTGGKSSGSASQGGHTVMDWKPNEAPLYGTDDSKGWKDNVDYQALINDAVKNNNYAQAAILEQQRNQKIDALGLNTDKTSKYSSYLGGTSLKSIADLYDSNTGTFHITSEDPNSKNTGAGKGLTEADLTWAKGSAAYNQDFQKYMNDMAARIAVYEASSDPVLRSHLPGMYNAMANYENQRNAKLVAMGRSDLVTNNWQDYSHSTKGWEKDINDVGNGAGMLSAEQIAGYEQTAAKLQNAFEQATNDYQREEIWKDLASYNLMLGRAWDASTGQWSASTVSPVKDYYGSSGGAYSYGAMTNGSMTGDAAQALAGKLLQQKKDQAANYGSDGVNWYENPESLLEGKPRIEANANLWPNINGWTIPDLKSAYESAKVKGDTETMDAAHAAAEAIRQAQGYSGGADGSQKIDLSSAQKAAQALSFPGLGGNIVSNIVGNIAGSALSGALSQAFQQGNQTGGSTTGGTTTLPGSTITLPGSSGSTTGTSDSSGITGGSWNSDQWLTEYQQAQKAYQEQMQAAMDAAKEQINKSTANTISQINSQRGQYQNAVDEANAAAQRNYMNAIDPNGATAEQLAALGLRSSGLTESSMISAGNTYQNSVNSNLQTLRDQFAQLDSAITQAQNSGDAALAQILAQYGQMMADRTASSADTILGYRQNQQGKEMAYQQWLYEMQQAAAQNAWNQQFQQNQFDWNKQQAQWEQQFQQQQAQWGQYNTESDRRLQNQMANRDTLLALMQYGYKPTEQDAANTGYTLAQLNAMYNSIKNAMRSGLYG